MWGKESWENERGERERERESGERKKESGGVGEKER